MDNDSSLSETCESLVVVGSSITYHMSGVPEKSLSGKGEYRSRHRTGRFEATDESRLRFNRNGLSDCRGVATAFRNIAEQGEPSADAAIVWTDGN
jgi:hypothetical protein